MFDDDKPRPPPAAPLETMSIEDLEARIERLKQEIAACERIVASKRGVRAAADALFGAPKE